MSKLVLSLESGMAANIGRRLARSEKARVYTCEVCERRQRASAFLLAPGIPVNNEVMERTTMRDVVPLRDVGLQTAAGCAGIVCASCMCVEHLIAKDGKTIIAFPVIIYNNIYGIRKWAGKTLGGLVADYVAAHPAPMRATDQDSAENVFDSTRTATDIPDDTHAFVRLAMAMHHAPRPLSVGDIILWTKWVNLALRTSPFAMRLSRNLTFRVFQSTPSPDERVTVHRQSQVAVPGSSAWTGRRGSAARRKAAKMSRWAPHSK